MATIFPFLSSEKLFSVQKTTCKYFSTFFVSHQTKELTKLFFLCGVYIQHTIEKPFLILIYLLCFAKRLQNLETLVND